MPDLCPDCGSDRLLVGIRHRCIPKSRGGGESRPAAVEVHEQDGINEGPRRPVAGVASSPREPKRKRGRPRVENRDKTLAATKPWEKAGMSRATWFARRAEARGAKKQ
jgi:hypothetical protein